MRPKLPFFFILLILTTIHTSCRIRYDAGLSPEKLDSLRDNYKEDAFRLAMRSLINNNSYRIEIPADSIEKYLRQLIVIHQFIDEKENTDSFAQVPAIHTFPTPSLTRIILSGPDDSPLANALRRRQYTDDDTLNMIIKEYDIRINELRSLDEQILLELNTSRAVNTYALAKYLSQMEGIDEANPELTVGSGMDILVQKKNSSYFYRYMKGEGDCMSGCIYKKYWIFQINKRNKVTYLGSTGSLSPE